jgi:hypothetical protein
MGLESVAALSDKRRALHCDARKINLSTTNFYSSFDKAVCR